MVDAIGGYHPDDGLQFDLDAGEMTVDTYSPFLGIFDAFGGALRGIFDAIAGLFRL